MWWLCQFSYFLWFMFVKPLYFFTYLNWSNWTKLRKHQTEHNCVFSNSCDCGRGTELAQAVWYVSVSGPGVLIHWDCWSEPFLSGPLIRFSWLIIWFGKNSWPAKCMFVNTLAPHQIPPVQRWRKRNTERGRDEEREWKEREKKWGTFFVSWWQFVMLGRTEKLEKK